MFKIPVDRETDLVLLQPWHAEELYELTVRNKEHLHQYLPWVGQITNVEQTRNFILSSLMAFAQNHSFASGIRYKGGLVGSIALHTIQWSSKQTSFGYWLSASHLGKGITTKACITLLHYAFQELQLNKVSIQARTDNEKSRAVPERIGFRKEGVFRQHERADDRYFDHVSYSMSAEEWFRLNQLNELFIFSKKK
jgi:ribosomal-protein-serine acetyltransferase